MNLDICSWIIIYRIRNLSREIEIVMGSTKSPMVLSPVIDYHDSNCTKIDDMPLTALRIYIQFKDG